MKNWLFETRAIHAGVEVDPETGATRTPIYQSAAFAHDSAESLEDTFKGRKFGYYYSRVSNPTVVALEKRLSALENGIGAVAVSSGMAAISNAVFTLAKSGENFVSSKSLFGSTYYLFNGVVKNSGIEARFSDSHDLAAMRSAIDEKTRFIYLETMGNPKLDIPDMGAIAELAKASGIPLVVDSTFTTPYLFNAKAYHVDIVIHATTKYLCGGGTTVGGAIIDMGEFSWKDSKSETLTDAKPFGDLAFLAVARKVRSNTGSALAPQNAFLSSVGLDTLIVRMDRHCENALELATFLEKSDVVSAVGYPGLPSHPEHALAATQFGGRFGGMLTLRLGSKANAYKFINGLKIAKNLVNLGDAKTLVVHPKSTIYRDFSDEESEAAGVFNDLVRVSVGLEHISDLMADFGQSLDAIAQ
ncbi:MAG: O-acetylhomoserine (thiol)-lyase [Candidatus Marinamargulisbacteria bacterium]|jgi:O-acetylhomoserine (thiol)-lyase